METWNTPVEEHLLHGHDQDLFRHALMAYKQKGASAAIYDVTFGDCPKWGESVLQSEGKRHVLYLTLFGSS